MNCFQSPDSLRFSSSGRNPPSLSSWATPSSRITCQFFSNSYSVNVQNTSIKSQNFWWQYTICQVTWNCLYCKIGFVSSSVLAKIISGVPDQNLMSNVMSSMICCSCWSPARHFFSSWWPANIPCIDPSQLKCLAMSEPSAAYQQKSAGHVRHVQHISRGLASFINFLLLFFCYQKRKKAKRFIILQWHLFFFKCEGGNPIQRKWTGFG